ncbi:B-box zinc finger protein 22 [Tanacetum coccineum]|uniref:B-box zinc finger protein 22 n=1 Tax=Tanacetum coccineum TaxID=301880 RepID=A0ABQ5A9X1_9ASTR
MDTEVPNFAAKHQASKRYKTSGSFNTGDASINVNVDVVDDEEEVQELRRPMGRDKAKGLKKKGPRSSGSSSSTNDEALVRLMVSELAMHNVRAIKMKKEERLAFLDIKKREVECRERELALRAEIKARFYTSLKIFVCNGDGYESMETFGYFFCLEDRALLCRKCDVAIHTVNTFVATHQRFLLTGVKVGAEAAGLDTPSTSKNSHPTKNSTSIPLTSTAQYTKPVPVQDAQTGGFAPPSLPFIGGSSANDIQQWQFDEFLGLTDLNQNYNYIGNVSSKVDNGKVGDSGCSPVLRAMEAELDECLGQVPESSWAVPQICSPPTASGLRWPKSYDHHHQFDTAAFVPDVCYQQSKSSLKRRRQ